MDHPAFDTEKSLPIRTDIADPLKSLRRFSIP